MIIYITITLPSALVLFALGLAALAVCLAWPVLADSRLWAAARAWARREWR